MNEQIKPKRKKRLQWLKRDWQLYLLILIPIVYFIVFKYSPMYGILMGFQEYNMFKGISGSEFVGLDIFKRILVTEEFLVAFKNTFMLNMLDLLIGFPTPIFLAIIINEISSKKFKKISQTILYFPHFISWVIIGGMTAQLFSNSGLVNNALKGIGASPIPFLTDKWWWLFMYLAIGVWQGAGWGTIIYLAAISGVDTELYEAASIDGADRLKQIRHILLPSIKPTVITLLILNLGKISSIGFERPFVLGNPFVFGFSDVLSTFTYRLGLQSGQFSEATAVGLFQSVIGVIFIVGADMIAKKLGENGIW